MTTEADQINRAEIVRATGEIVQVVPEVSVNLGMLRADSPASFVSGAVELSTALADIIKQRKLFSNIQGREFVKVEGWTTLAAMLGVTPHEVNVTETDGAFTATVELRRIADGGVVGRASAECGGPDEQMWQKRPRNARRSMALTRATGKACRLAFSWIMTLAGYEVTPAEEMGHEQTPQTEPVRRKVNADEIAAVKDKLHRNGKSVGAFLSWAGSVQNPDKKPLDYLPEVWLSTYCEFMDMQG